MTDIFEEVDQSLREDTFASWWKRWQWVVYGVVGTAIVGVAGFQVWLGMRDAEIDKSAVILDEPIKALGVFHVPVRLHADVEAKVKVWVVKAAG